MKMFCDIFWRQFSGFKCERFRRHISSNIAKYLFIYLFIYLCIYLFIYSFIYLKSTTPAVQIYTNKIVILLKIVSMLININWKTIKLIKWKSRLKKRSHESKGTMKAFTVFIKPFLDITKKYENKDLCR